MTTEVQFLKAIREQPDSEANWRVYADWLDERGDPRGEVLRLLAFVGTLQNLEYYPTQKSRFDELRRLVDDEWLNEVLRLWALRFRPYEHHGQPSPADIGAMWQDLEIRWVSQKKSERPQPVRDLLDALVYRGRELGWWGRVVLEQFHLSQHPVLTWFGSRRRWADLQLLQGLTASPVVRRALFGKDATPSKRSPDPWANLRWVKWDIQAGPAAEFADQVADFLDLSRFTVDLKMDRQARSEDRALGKSVAFALFGYRLSEMQLCHSKAEWAPWPCTLVQSTWIFIDPRDWSLTILCAANGD
jgi:uncharacterized protein (TIGR02996 family)